MSITLGLTGSIGMGKSTTAALFAGQGAEVWDADAVVHTLYAPGGAAVDLIERAFPGVAIDGGIDRMRLRDRLADDPEGFARLNAIVHPLVAEHRSTFRRTARAWLLVFDIPLLFETDSAGAYDATACVWVDAGVQRERVLARPNMTEDALELILSRQWPIDRKRAAADYEIETTTPGTAERDVAQVISDLRGKHA
ncbi:MAG: dephospho-CoA kinase [Shimia sp.]